MKRIICILIFLIGLFVFWGTFYPIQTFAEDLTNQNNAVRYYLGSPVNTGWDDGYSETNKIEYKDPHFGWILGKFFVSGYTRETKDDKDNPVFLKNPADKVTLWFNLEQDMDMLNNDSTLSITEDQNGYDEYFGITKTNFGRGTLITRHTDYQNLPGNPVLYTDFLAAKTSLLSDTEVELFEEGDYEIALNYEIKKSPMAIAGHSILPTYTNYRIFFSFSVRNGNCMIYPLDVITNSELMNSSITEDGFFLDLAKSRYLDINIKKEVLNDSADGLTEDVRFNIPAKDGDQYTEEGIYTITVKNRYTNETTTKKIYVGTNNVLKAFVTSNLSLNEIKEQLAAGAQVADDGSIIPPQIVPPTVTTTDAQTVSAKVTQSPIYERTTQLKTDLQPDSEKRLRNRVIWSIVILVPVCVLCIFFIRKRNGLKKDLSNDITIVEDTVNETMINDLSNDEKEEFDK